MREHPIPQDITGYKFHLIGDMTLKQFGELALGVIVALLFYRTNLISIIKWPLVGLSAFLGFAMAFVPFEERPLDHWIITFFKVLYKPTKFYWRRTVSLPEAFTYQPTKSKQEQDVDVDLSPARRQKIKEFLQSVNQPQLEQDEWDLKQNKQVQSILASFDQVDVPESVGSQQTQPDWQKPNLKVRVRKLKKQPQQKNSNQTQPTAAKATPPAPPPASPTEPEPTPKQNSQPSPPTQAAPSHNQEQPNQKKQGQAPSRQTPPKPEKPDFNHTAETATVNKELPFPNKPSQPNKIVGMALGPRDELVGGALVEIQDQSGQVVRAVKTNSLGQFFVSSPLDSGVYFINVNKDGWKFPTQKLELSGQIIVEPLEIRGVTIG